MCKSKLSLQSMLKLKLPKAHDLNLNQTLVVRTCSLNFSSMGHTANSQGR